MTESKQCSTLFNIFKSPLMLDIPSFLASICTVPEHLSPIQVSLDLHLLLIHHHECIHDHSKCHRCDYYNERIKKKKGQ